MFGYVRAYKPEMKVKDFDVYTAVYCGVCKNLGRNFGQLSRLGLSYDIAFLCLLRLSFAERQCDIKHQTCLFNPLVKKPCALGNDDIFDYATSVGALMAYYKLLDNLSDEGLFKRIGLRLVKPYFSHLRKKACRSYPEIDDICCELNLSQKQAESEKSGNIDLAADSTGTALGKILAFGFDGERAAHLYRLGYCIGKAIYIMDAVDDFYDDINKKRYNPFIYDDFVGENADPVLLERISEPVITNCISEGYSTFLQLDCTYYRDILQNIITLGMDSSQKQIFHKLMEEKNNEQKPL